MGQVVVQVNGRPYTMQCNDGEEAHLSELAELLDAEVEGIKRAVGQVGDVRLLVMAGLIVADKLSEALKQIESLQDQLEGAEGLRSRAMQQSQSVEARVTERLEAAAQRLEAMTRDAHMGQQAAGG